MEEKLKIAGEGLRRRLSGVLSANQGKLRLRKDNQALTGEVVDFRRSAGLSRRDCAATLGLSGNQLDYVLARSRKNQAKDGKRLKKELKFHELTVAPAAGIVKLDLPGGLSAHFSSVNIFVSFLRHWSC